MSEVLQLNAVETSSRKPPKRIVRPCDYGLARTIHSLEDQVGTVEAYNKLCNAAEALKSKIDSGNAKAQLLMFATDPDFIYAK